MAEPIHHETLDLYARVGDAEHIIGQAKVPVYVTLDNTKGRLRDRVTFTVGEPVVTAHEGWDAKGQGAKAALKKWRDILLAEMNRVVAEEAATPAPAPAPAPETAPEPTPEPTPEPAPTMTPEASTDPTPA